MSSFTRGLKFNCGKQSDLWQSALALKYLSEGLKTLENVILE